MLLVFSDTSFRFLTFSKRAKSQRMANKRNPQMSHINVNCKYIQYWPKVSIHGPKIYGNGIAKAKTDFYGYILVCLASQQLALMLLVFIIIQLIAFFMFCIQHSNTHLFTTYFPFWGFCYNTFKSFLWTGYIKQRDLLDKSLVCIQNTSAWRRKAEILPFFFNSHSLSFGPNLM